MKAAIVIAAFATVFSFTPALAAGNLVVNGGFETGNFAGWQQVGDMTSTGVYPRHGYLPVDKGDYSAAFGPSFGYGGITQTIKTAPGANYIVSFDLANTDELFNNEVIFSFDDGFQIDSYQLPAFGFQTISLPVTASGRSADVTFLFYNAAGYFLLDNVSVTSDSTATSAVPEPASWGLMLAGFAAIGVTMRRRQLVTA